MQVPTIKVIGEKGQALIINESDFIPGVHRKWGQRKSERKSEAEPEPELVAGDTQAYAVDAARQELAQEAKQLKKSLSKSKSKSKAKSKPKSEFNFEVG